MSLRLIEMTSEDSVDMTEKDFDKNIKIIDFWSEILNDKLHSIKILTNADNTESILEIIEKKWKKNAGFRIVIYKIEATLPLPDEKENKENNKRAACTELVQNLSSQITLNKTYFLTVVLSTIVASIGLIHGDIPVVIGAMVIAPFLSADILFSLAITIGDLKLTIKAIIVMVLGLGLSLIISVLIALLLPFEYEGHEIMNRTKIHITDIALALVSGSAGALAYTTDLPASLVGVMVAVSLLPPLVIAGLF